MKKYTFHVNNMHCQSCVVLTESELAEHPKVSYAKSSLSNLSVEVTGDFGEMALDDIAKELSGLLSKHSLSVEKRKKERNWSEFKIAVPVAAAFTLTFLVLQKMGIVNLISADNVSYGTAFIVGVIASLSTCMAVVGGLVLSMSATFASESNRPAENRGMGRYKPIVIFHTGRIISFFILGGVIGAIGSAFTLNASGTFILNLVIGLAMLVMGINLLDVFDFAKKLQPAMPKFIGKRALSVSKLNHTLTPFLVGILTFFLPCGFTQSMQIYTLSTGGFLAGGLTMLFFALGTFPVLALVSFSSFGIQNSPKSGIFFKSAGLVVIMFAISNLINSFVVMGLLPPLFNF